MEEVNEPELPKKEKQVIRFFADVYKDKSKRKDTKLEQLIAEVNRYKMKRV